MNLLGGEFGNTVGSGWDKRLLIFQFEGLKKALCIKLKSNKLKLQ